MQHHRYDVRQSILPFLFAAGIVLFHTSTASVRAQGNWVSSDIFTGRDTLSSPCIVITPELDTYIIYNSSDQVHHWLMQAEIPWSVQYSIRRQDPGTPYVYNPVNLLNTDSNSALHFITAIGRNTPCLQYGTTDVTGNNNIFDTLELVGDGFCDLIGEGAASGIDASGNLHLVFEWNDSLLYIRRSADGIWNRPTPIPSPFAVNRSPSLAVAPSGELHLTFVARNRVSDPTSTVLYLRGLNGTYNPPVIVAVRDGYGNADPAPITLGPNNVLHIVFSDHSSGRLPALKGIRGDRQGWEGVRTIAEGDLYRFDNISLAFDRYGATHVVAGYVLSNGQSTSDREIGYAHDAGTTWTPFTQVTNNDIDDNVSNPGSGFLALRDSLLLVASVADQTSDGWSSITLSRRILNFNPTLGVNPDTIDFGAITSIGVDTIVTLANLGRRRYEPLRLEAIGQIDTDLLKLSAQGPQPPNPIPGDSSIRLSLSLSFKKPGTFEEPVIIKSNGGNATIIVKGVVTQQGVVDRTFGLDTTEVDVGTVRGLICRADPPIAEGEEITELQMRIRFDPDALFPRSVVPISPDIKIFRQYDEAGTIDLLLQSGNGKRIAGTELFRIDFEGLLTADPQNEVELTVVPPAALPVPETNPGLVIVHGCEVGRIPGFGKGGFAAPPAPNPAREDITLSYVAPEGVSVSVRITDLRGGLLREESLPEGTGETEEKRLDLRDLPTGHYFIELWIGQRLFTGRLIRE